MKWMEKDLKSIFKGAQIESSFYIEGGKKWIYKLFKHICLGM